MASENTELELNKRVQVSFSNYVCQVDHTVSDSHFSEESTLPSLVLAIVADLHAETFMSYHMAAEELSKVAIAALLHSLCQKKYPRYSLSALCSSGDSPQVLFIGGSKAFDQASTYFPKIIGTNNIKLLKSRESSYVSATYIERLLQRINSNLLKQQSVSKVSLQSPVKVSFNHGELRSLLEDYFFQHNSNISP